MKDAIKELVEKKYGKIADLPPVKRSEAFLDVYKDLAELFERDFNYALQVIERKTK